MTSRITIEPGKRSGQPCVRGLRITVWDVLSWLAAGITEQQILDDYQELEPDDFRAEYDFAARMGTPAYRCRVRTRWRFQTNPTTQHSNRCDKRLRRSSRKGPFLKRRGITIVL
jgi:uncharacterized protein (DUF433 family)